VRTNADVTGTISVDYKVPPVNGFLGDYEEVLEIFSHIEASLLDTQVISPDEEPHYMDPDFAPKNRRF